MKLKHQLLLLALLSALFPVTGWIALKSVDHEFRISIEQASKNTLISLKSSVQELLENNNNALNGFIPVPIKDWLLDGDETEWEAITAYQFHNGKQQLLVKLALVKGQLAMYIEATDATADIQRLGNDNNDYIIIAVANERGLYQYQLNRQAEGSLLPNRDSQNKPGFSAYWHEKSQGYTIEILFDRADFHHIGWVMVDVEQPDKVTGTLQTNSTQTIKLEPLLVKDQKFQKIIDNITPPDHHFIIQDQQKRIIYESNKLPAEQDATAWQWIITPIYQWLFAVDTSNQQWFQREDGMAGVKQALQDGNISFTLKSMLPKGQQNMIQTLLKTGVMMISVVIFLMLAYLLYAVFLAWRIKKLNNAMHTVLDDSGKLKITMPSHSAADEIGQLSRGIESMLTEMSEYTQYLKDFGSRLSHEMKTPLAVVQSSLDNMAFENDGEFLQRAQQGTKRLRFILNQLSELSRLKYALEQTPKEPLDMTDFIKQLSAAYQSVVTNLSVNLLEQPLMIHGSAELLAQMVDKLVDNAKSFTPDDGRIKLNISQHNNFVVLSVFNSGSQLPENDKHNIFDSLVSVRQEKTTHSTHLGLGLYLVRLIARYHDAEVSAKNTNEPIGVQFSVKFQVHSENTKQKQQQ